MSVILNYNILIVDDEDDYREMFALILEEKGYNSYKATSVKEAKEIIKNNFNLSVNSFSFVFKGISINSSFTNS